MSLQNLVLLHRWTCRFVRLNSVLVNSTGSRIQTLSWQSSTSKLHPKIQLFVPIRSYSAHIPEPHRKHIVQNWLRAPFERLRASGKLKKWFLLSLLVSIPFLWPISFIYVSGLGVSVLRSNLISSIYFRENDQRIYQPYVPQFTGYQVADGIFFLYTSLIYQIPATLSAFLSVNENHAIMIMGIVMSLFFTIAGLYFVPSALGYALSQQLSGNRWLAIFQFRKIFNFLMKSDLSLYHYAIFTSFVCSLMTFFVTGLTLGLGSGPFIVWQTLVMAEAFGDAFRPANS